MTQPELLRLQRVAVEGLFGVYDHDVHLNLDDRVTLLHGPNGVGKTVVLGMIDALLRENFDYFGNIPFSRFFLEFHDGSAVDLAAAGSRKTGGNEHYELKLSRRGNVRSATVNRVSRAGRIAARIDYLRPHPELSQAWIDVRDDEVLDAAEVVSRYADAPAPEQEEAKWFGDFLENARAHFIKAQRLVRVDWSSFPPLRYMRTPPRKSIISAVDECSEHFRNRIADTLVRYGRESQALDQTFPQRLISATDEMAIDDLKGADVRPGSQDGGAAEDRSAGRNSRASVSRRQSGWNGPDPDPRHDAVRPRHGTENSGARRSGEARSRPSGEREPEISAQEDRTGSRTRLRREERQWSGAAAAITFVGRTAGTGVALRPVVQGAVEYDRVDRRTQALPPRGVADGRRLGQP